MQGGREREFRDAYRRVAIRRYVWLCSYPSTTLYTLIFIAQVPPSASQTFERLLCTDIMQLLKGTSLGVARCVGREVRVTLIPVPEA